MRSVDYSDVLEGSLALAGIPLTADFDYTDGTFALFRTFHNRRLRIAWELHAWPDICRIERRSFRPPWSASQSYAAGAEVLDVATLTYFQALKASANEAPTTDGETNDAYWTPCQTAYSASDYDATATYTLGAVVHNLTDGEFYQMHNGDLLAVITGTAPQTITMGRGADVNGRPSYTEGVAGAQYILSWDGSQWVLVYSYGHPTPTVYTLFTGVGDVATPDLVTAWNYVANGFMDASNVLTVAFAVATTAPPDTTYWGLLTPFQRYVAFEQTDLNGAALTPIAEVFKAWDRDLRVTTKTARLDYLVTNDGFAFTTTKHSTAYVWLNYRLRRPTLTGSPFDATLSYTLGRQVYYVNATTGTGNFYTANTTTAAGESPATDPDKWDVVELPYIFREYLAQGAYADWLTSDGQGDKASAVEGQAVGLLELEADKLQRQQQQTNRLDWR